MEIFSQNTVSLLEYMRDSIREEEIVRKRWQLSGGTNDNPTGVTRWLKKNSCIKINNKIEMSFKRISLPPYTQTSLFENFPKNLKSSSPQGSSQ